MLVFLFYSLLLGVELELPPLGDVDADVGAVRAVVIFSLAGETSYHPGKTAFLVRLATPVVRAAVGESSA